MRLASALSLVAATFPGYAGPVSAGTNCETTWNATSGSWLDSSKWSAGIPDETMDACLPAPAAPDVSYTVDVDKTTAAEANVLDIGSGATLRLISDGVLASTLTVAAVNNHGTVQLGGVAGFHQPATLESVNFSNSGTIVTMGFGNHLNTGLANAVIGTVNVSSSSALFMSKPAALITNSGTIVVNGAFDILNAQRFTMSSGTISGNAGLHVAGGAFHYLGGNITTAFPPRLDGAALRLNPASGTGHVLITQAGNTLETDIASGVTVIVAGGYVDQDGVLTSSASRINNGTIRLRTDGAPETAKLIFTSGAVLTNNGTIESQADGGGDARVIQAPLVNQGTFNVKHATVFDQPSATLVQSSGTSDFQANLNLAGSGGTFTLNGGTLKGFGSLTGNLDNAGGTVAPGASPAVLTVAGSYAQGSGGTLAAEIGGSAAGSQSDRLVVTGNATLAGTLALSRINSFVPANSFSYDFLTYGSRSGTFSTVTGTSAGTGKTFVVNYNAGAAKLTVLSSGPVRRPDAKIKFGSGRFVGNDIYNTTGAGQSKSKSGGPGSKFTFTINIQNDGTNNDKFKVLATGANVNGYTVKFKRGTTLITSAVVNGTFTTATIAPGSAVAIKCIVTIGSGAANPSQISRLVTATSFNDANAKDAVGLTVSRP